MCAGVRLPPFNFSHHQLLPSLSPRSLLLLLSLPSSPLLRACMGGSFLRSSIVFTCGELWHKEKARKRCGGLHNGAHKHRRRVPLRAPGGGGLELLVHLQGCNLSLTRCYLGHTPAAHQDAPVRPSDLLLFANGYVVALSDSAGEAAGTPATRARAAAAADAVEQRKDQIVSLR